MAKTPVSDNQGSVKTGLLEGNIIETTYQGHISAAMATEVRDSMARLLLQYPGSDWLLDTTNATGVAAAPREVTTGVFDLFRERGGRRIAVVVRASAIRMFATTFAFAFGIPMKTFERRSDALAHLRSAPT